ncbi:MAG: ferritin-like domain-containing protein, partial [Mycolicibacterium sp.]|nr:ferritin-like domain-containing protein [Mycolicibacterium sp.]
MTSAEPTTPRPQSPDDAALAAAVAAEHATIYGYGFVSAHSGPDVNQLVTESLSEHRDRREAAIAMLASRSVSPPIAAIGYQLPISVTSPTDAANLAVRMEDDDAVAWRAVIASPSAASSGLAGRVVEVGCGEVTARIASRPAAPLSRPCRMPRWIP